MISLAFGMTLAAVEAAGAAIQAGGRGPALTPGSSWGEVFGFLGLGLLIVLATLVGLAVLCALIGVVFKRSEAVAKAKAAAKAAPAADAPPVAPQVDDAPLVAIAAAVAVMLENHQYRITRIAPAHGLDDHNPWAEEGRRQIFAGHVYAHH
ncbi:MAG: OadG family protein [Acidobacteriota bacterium]|jgi:Na+-transporting methylmalonyl-CoA/oxaloacetate decarboxylase gamma subunit|nr:OadG family protein [Acidobacteriota bacterium]